jgi:hypothetical protein
MKEQLIPFGYAFLATCVVAILLPYLLRRNDLVTARNILLVGFANYMGLSAVSSATWADPYFVYSDVHYVRYMVGAVLFLATFLVGYHLLGQPARMAADRWPRRWPMPRPTALYVVAAAALGIALLRIFGSQIPVVAQLAGVIGAWMAITAVALTFWVWYTRPANGMAFLIMAGLLVLALLLSLTLGAGRRRLMGVLICLPILLYWFRYRPAPPLKTVIRLGIAGLIAVAMLTGYTAVRHRDKAAAEGGGIARAVESAKLAAQRAVGFAGADSIFGGDSVEASLVALAWYDGYAETQPFFIIEYVAANPFPRFLWEFGAKPEALGQTLPRDTGQWVTGYVNWGITVVGHAFMEGGPRWGYAFCIFYGLLIAWGARWLDTVLLSQRDNPFVIATLTAGAAQLFVMGRGDVALMIVEAGGGIVGTILLIQAARLVFGTGLWYPKGTTTALARDRESGQWVPAGIDLLPDDRPRGLGAAAAEPVFVAPDVDLRADADQVADLSVATGRRNVSAASTDRPRTRVKAVWANRSGGAG